MSFWYGSIVFQAFPNLCPHKVFQVHLISFLPKLWTSLLVAQTVKNPPAMGETQIWSLGWEDPLEKGKATHSNILAWKFSWTEEPGGLQSMGSQWVRHCWETNTSPFIHTDIYLCSSLQLMLFIFLRLLWTCTKDLSVYFFHLVPLLPCTSWDQTLEIWCEEGKMPEGKWEAGTWLPLGQITSRLNAFGGSVTKYSTCSVSKFCPERLYISWNFTWLKIIIPREIFFFPHGIYNVFFLRTAYSILKTLNKYRGEIHPEENQFCEWSEGWWCLETQRQHLPRVPNWGRRLEP